MTTAQKMQIESLRKAGYGCKAIADKLDCSINTIKSYCQRHHLESPKLPKNIRLCLQCGQEVIQIPHRKEKKFCCDKCRTAWWNAHSESIHKKSQQIFICPICGEEFSAYDSSKRKYCSRICYGKSKGVNL